MNKKLYWEIKSIKHLKSDEIFYKVETLRYGIVPIDSSNIVTMESVKDKIPYYEKAFFRNEFRFYLIPSISIKFQKSDKALKKIEYVSVELDHIRFSDLENKLPIKDFIEFCKDNFC